LSAVEEITGQVSGALRWISATILIKMFTGLIEYQGNVTAISDDVLTISPASPPWTDLAEGESVAVDGACLTVTKMSAPTSLAFELSPETLGRTTLGRLKMGDVVNLERAMRLNERLGGHIVQGHVDDTGQVLGREDQEKYSEFTIQVPEQYDHYLIDKGSVAVNGISLTVIKPSAGRFTVWIIPATLEKTNLKNWKTGELVNLEFDLIAKYVEKLTAGWRTLTAETSSMRV
jgi:riboflavin synthase